MANIYEISEDIRNLIETIGDCETDDEARVLASEFLAERDEEFRGKVDAYCSAIQERKALLGLRKSEAARIRELYQSDEKSIERARRALQFVMEQILETSRIETVRFKLNIQNVGGVRALEILPTESIPEIYCITTRTIDTEALRADLESREEELAEAKRTSGEDLEKFLSQAAEIDEKYAEAIKLGILKPRSRTLVIK